MLKRIINRVRREYWQRHDAIGERRIQMRRNAWPCDAKQYLVVGCQSSGTTPISHLLLKDACRRFLIEGEQNWVWDLCCSVYQGESQVRDYPRLQLFDGIKVPGFAAILDRYVEEFPNSAIVYVLRDPRDVVASAYKTWKISTHEELSNIPWVKATWLGIEATDPVARLVERWRLYLEVSQRVPNVTYVRYEDFCMNKVKCLSEVASSLDLRFNEKRVALLCDKQASGQGVRKYKPAGPGGWKDGFVSERDAKLIEDICGDHMRNWGYL